MIEGRTQEVAIKYFKRWYFWATHSKLKPIIKAASIIWQTKSLPITLGKELIFLIIMN